MSGGLLRSFCPVEAGYQREGPEAWLKWEELSPGGSPCGGPGGVGKSKVSVSVSGPLG